MNNTGKNITKVVKLTAILGAEALATSVLNKGSHDANDLTQYCMRCMAMYDGNHCIACNWPNPPYSSYELFGSPWPFNMFSKKTKLKTCPRCENIWDEVHCIPCNYPNKNYTTEQLTTISKTGKF